MEDTLIIQRKTKYSQAIERILESRGHATNFELLTELQKIYPDLSATTVHRATTRLANRGIISMAPHGKDGSMCYDANIVPHDHFQCMICGVLRDADVVDKVIPILESSIEDCHISGRLTIGGICKNCKEEKND